MAVNREFSAALRNTEGRSIVCSGGGKDAADRGATDVEAEIVDTLKQQCPGFAQMRELVLGFRTILRLGKLATLQRWMQRALKTWHSRAGALCADFETGPQCSGSGGDQTV